MAQIEIKNLGKVYSEEAATTRALSNISLSIEKGDFVAIMGPSGSGKSTLLHILGTLDAPTEGEYFFEDRDVRNRTTEEAAKIRNQKMGFIFQSFNLLPRVSAIENVKMPLVYSMVPEKEWDDRARKALESVGLAHRMEHVPAALSGGERQRVAIARALVLNPEIIFADEPTGNLDSKSGQIIMSLLQELNEKSGHTIILITHETYTAEHANRVIKLHDGQIVSDERITARRDARDHFEK